MFIMITKKLIFSLPVIASIAIFCIGYKNYPSKHAGSFRDLNKNGKMDVYEDTKQPFDARINDLLKQMTIEEKAGMMFINGKVNDSKNPLYKFGFGLSY